MIILKVNQLIIAAMKRCNKAVHLWSSDPRNVQIELYRKCVCLCLSTFKNCKLIYDNIAKYIPIETSCVRLSFPKIVETVTPFIHANQ